MEGKIFIKKKNFFGEFIQIDIKHKNKERLLNLYEGIVKVKKMRYNTK